MSLTAADLLDDRIKTSLGGETRIFFEGAGLPELKAVRRYVESLDGLEILSEQEETNQWKLRFRYHGFAFLVDSNDHAGCALFLVDDPHCPDSVLLHVIQHFEALHEAGGGPRLLIMAFLAFFIALAVVLIATFGREKNQHEIDARGNRRSERYPGTCAAAPRPGLCRVTYRALEQCSQRSNV